MFFGNDIFFASMEGLKYHCPVDSRGRRVVVSDPFTTKGGKHNKSLNLHKGHVKHMSVEAAFRELLANLIDAVVEANNESFVGLEISESTRRGDKSVISIQNDKVVFGEIVDSPSKISFSNFGPIIETFEQIIQIGASKKHLKKNQGGQHGEGLKRSALKLLLLGCTVEIYFAITENDDTEFRHLTFKLNNDKCLAYSVSMLNPFERFKGADDAHRFEVIVGKPKDNARFPDFVITDFMITKGIRGAVDENDRGIILSDVDYSGEVYVWHFFVSNYRYVVFGYDFFLPKLTRDRDNIHSDQLSKFCFDLKRVFKNICSDLDCSSLE